MWHQLKHKVDLYFDSTFSVVNTVVNNPKAGGPVSAYLLGVGLVEFNEALQTVSILVGLLVGGATLWVLLEKRTHDKKRRKEEGRIRALKTKKLENENRALEDHIKRPSK